MTAFFRLIEEAEKGETLRDLCRFDNRPAYNRVFLRNSEQFAAIPGAPFAYWALEAAVKAYRIHKSFEGQGNFAGQGVATADNFRFIRLHWEIPSDRADDSTWFGLAKGGAAKKYYADIYLNILWRADGAEFKAWASSLYDNSHWSRITMNYAKYGLHGLTWSRRSMAFAVRALPAKCVFGDKGPAIFTKAQTAESLLCACALLNSKAYNYLLGLQLSRVDLAKSYETGIVGRTPFPAVSDEDEKHLASLAHRLWRNLRTIDSKSEISHAFLLPSILMQRATNTNSRELHDECSLLQAEIDDFAFRMYGFEGQDRETIESMSNSDPLIMSGAERAVASPNEEDDDEAEPGDDDAQAMLSWAVGVSFCRFDIRLATGERPMPPESTPFEPLPAKSSGMVPDGDPPFMPCRGILTDDRGHVDDLATRVTSVYERVGEPAPEPDLLRRSLAREFFASHIKVYSKSRRKAPIYWQLATPSASYSIWLYVHAFSKDTLFRVQTDYAAAKLAHEHRQLENLRREVGATPNAAQRKAIEAQEAFVEELLAFVDEVKRIAPLWNPDLDDGVVINFAPLWRLVPQHRAWQKELRATWYALCRGEYDWAHLAMHLWPERVVPRCTTDRSLAIAHDLEDVFWFEDEDGKWKPRSSPTRLVQELVHERTSSAVQAALKSLLDAPVAATGGNRGRGHRGAAAAADGGTR